MQPYKPQISPQVYGESPGAAATGHETKDVNVGAVLGFLLALAICGIAVFAVCFGIYGAFNKYISKEEGAPATWNASQNREESDQRAALAKQGANNTQIEQSQYEMHVERFPTPRLQTDDVRDMQMLREQEDLQLDNYMWADQSAGKVVIPIDRAIDILAQRGLPSVPNAIPSNVAAPYSMGVVRVESNSSHNPKR
ncbi:MAG: hypothetical protein NVS9B15_02420 [Acidobacteriaceae bacterium]